jgi:streptogramin lyase
MRDASAEGSTADAASNGPTSNPEGGGSLSDSPGGSSTGNGCAATATPFGTYQVSVHYSHDKYCDCPPPDVNPDCVCTEEHTTSTYTGPLTLYAGQDPWGFQDGFKADFNGRTLNLVAEPDDVFEWNSSMRGEVITFYDSPALDETCDIYPYDVVNTCSLFKLTLDTTTWQITAISDHHEEHYMTFWVDDDSTGTGNRVKNGDGTTFVCGGGCSLCAAGAECRSASECQSKICSAPGGDAGASTCQAATCTDDVENGNETAVDCGGPTCPHCADGLSCTAASDCQSGFCTPSTAPVGASTCQTPTCSDGFKNGTETDVDCGGSTCPHCATGLSCHGGTDCQSGFCTLTGGAGLTCQAPTCSDGFKNGDETDVDCGGPACSPCLTGKKCTAPSDCEFGVCKSNVCAVDICGSQCSGTCTASGCLVTGQITEFPVPNAAQNPDPRYITEGPDGALWFTAHGTSAIGSYIGRMTVDGTATKFGLGTGYYPERITAGLDGKLWFVGVALTSMTLTGKISKVQIPTANAGQACPIVGPDGNIWFAESYVDQVGRVGANGVVSNEFPVPVQGNMYNIATGPDGNVWFTLNGGVIGRVTPSGVVTEFATPSPGALTGGPDGNVWFSGANGISRITPAGAITTFGASAQDIVRGPDDTLWFTDNKTHCVGRVSMNGVITEVPAPSAGTLMGITPGPDGNVWFVEETQEKIARLTLSSVP